MLKNKKRSFSVFENKGLFTCNLAITEEQYASALAVPAFFVVSGYNSPTGYSVNFIKIAFARERRKLISGNTVTPAS